jgi:hypothetical protein
MTERGQDTPRQGRKHALVRRLLRAKNDSREMGPVATAHKGRINNIIAGRAFYKTISNGIQFDIVL